MVLLITLGKVTLLPRENVPLLGQDYIICDRDRDYPNGMIIVKGNHRRAGAGAGHRCGSTPTLTWPLSHTPLHISPFTAPLAFSGRTITFLPTLLPSDRFPPRRLPNVLSSIIYLFSPRAPSYRIAMSNEAHKADQIAYRYYTKLLSVVHSARATAEPNPLAKVDKWVRHCSLSTV